MVRYDYSIEIQKINTKKQEAQLTTVYLLCNPPKGDNDSTQSDGNNNGKFSGWSAALKQ